MGIRDILRPKSRGEIDQAIANLITESPDLVQFIHDYGILDSHRTLKAYDYVARTLLKEKDPHDVYIIFTNNPLFKRIQKALVKFEYTNGVTKNIKFMSGPFSYTLVKKRSKVAELYGGHLQAFMIGIDHILELLTEK